MLADVLAIGAHPDDVELVIGGTLHKLASMGNKVVIADLTRGEMGTRGDVETRRRESQAARDILGITDRINLELPDGKLENNLQNRKLVIEIIREFRPVIVLCHHWNDAHPDHAAAGEILSKSLYPGGFKKFPARGEPYRPHAALFYMSHFPFQPSFIVDTTNHFDAKYKAIQCYKSQLYNSESKEPETMIARSDFIKKIEGRDRYFGGLILKTFGEPFFMRRALPMDNPVEHFRKFPQV